MTTPRYELGDETGFRAFLAKESRALVLMRGHGCPYSATFEPVFTQVEAPPGWSRAIRIVEEGGRGRVAEARGIDITPTVVAFADGHEIARLDGKLFMGIPRTTFGRWLKTLAQHA